MELTSFGQGKRQRRPLPASFALGIGAGVLVGVLISVLPIVSFAFLLGALLVTAIAVARKDAPRASFASGVLVAIGSYLTFGAISSIAACSKTDDFCGQANIWPLALFGIVTLGAGAVGAAITAFRQRRHAIAESQDGG